MSTADKTKVNSKKVIVKEQGYDETPYTSYPFEFARPEKMCAVGTIFGLTPPPMETARILELGCAGGGNIIRFAEENPKSYTLGVDLSKVQIDQGAEIVKKLKLKNIDLKHMSITDLDESYGKFDYIIVHGVFSWVPKFVKDSILDISNKLLTKNGMCFISYNALPGWNMTNTIRELMIYHSQNFPDVKDKLVQSRAVLAFLQESLAEQNTPHAKFMQEAAKTMAIREDNYVRHEYLEEENQAFYLHEFVKMANEKGMNYLGDINIASMSIKHMPKKTAEKLNTIGDMARTEQYADFIKNTMFKCSLIVHKEAKFSYAITKESMDKFYYHAKISIDKNDGDINVTDKSIANFYFNGEKEQKVTTDHPIAKASLMALVNNLGSPLLASEVVKEVEKVLPSATKAEIESNIFTNFSELLIVNYINYTISKPKSVNALSKKPKISEFALLQSKQGKGTSGMHHITNKINAVFAFDDSRVALVQSLDGTRDVKTLQKEAFERLKSGEITAMSDNKKIEDEKQLKDIADALVNETLENLRTDFCLIA